MSTQDMAGGAAKRRATGLAESIAAHGDQPQLPTDLDAALAEAIADDQRRLAPGGRA